MTPKKPKHRPCLAISGPHGVGKSTLLSLVSARLNFHLPPNRPHNPFENSPFLSMLFYVLSFSDRDRRFEALGKKGLVDRHTLIDLLVEAHVFNEIQAITDRELNQVIRFIKDAVDQSILPKNVVLLYDDPANILRRIQLRPIPCGHICELEADINYLRLLTDSFVDEFKTRSLLIKYKVNNPSMRMHILDVAGRCPDDLVNELLDIVTEIELANH